MNNLENPKNLYHELKQCFLDYQPNDEYFLEENPEVAEQIEYLDSLNPKTDEELIEAIADLSDFVDEWFPDLVDEEEKNRISDILDKASEMVREKRVN